MCTSKYVSWQIYDPLPQQVLMHKYTIVHRLETRKQNWRNVQTMLDNPNFAVQIMQILMMSTSLVLTPPLDCGLMTVLVLVAFPDPHSELHEPQELHDDTWQSITGENRKMNNFVFNVGKC